MIGVTFLVNTAKAAQFYTKCQDMYDIVKSHTWQNRLCKLNTYMSDEIEIVLFCVRDRNCFILCQETQDISTVIGNMCHICLDIECKLPLVCICRFIAVPM